MHACRLSLPFSFAALSRSSRRGLILVAALARLAFSATGVPKLRGVDSASARAMSTRAVERGGSNNNLCILVCLSIGIAIGVLGGLAMCWLRAPRSPDTCAYLSAVAVGSDIFKVMMAIAGACLISTWFRVGGMPPTTSAERPQASNGQGAQQSEQGPPPAPVAPTAAAQPERGPAPAPAAAQPALEPEENPPPAPVAPSVRSGVQVSIGKGICRSRSVTS